MATPRLVADIGGTNARFALVDADGHRPRAIESVRCASAPDVTAAVRAYLERAGAAPDSACFAVAAPVTGDRVTLTNGPWSFSRAALTRELGLDRLLVVNDFEAQAASLSQLDGSDLEAIADARRRRHATRAVLGPGTGLGIAAAVPAGDGWCVVTGEGGHAGFAPVTGLEADIVRIVAGRHGRVSNERLLSGPGLAEIHAALARIDGIEPDGAGAETITEAAVDGSLARCRRTVGVFLDMLASVAGDVALYFGATGGVHLAGGIVPRVAGLIDPVAFRRRFEAKGRMTEYARGIPAFIVVTPHSGLIGASVLLSRDD